MDEKLANHLRVWQEKKIIRIIYQDFYEKIFKFFKNKNGINLEIGSGIAKSSEFIPNLITSDISFHENLIICFNALKIPFKDNSVDNIVMLDVFHHLSDPLGFLSEVFRVLKPEGRIIMIEPFPSPFSLIIYKLFHPEPFIMNIDYFNSNSAAKKNPWDANQAIPYLIFYKHNKKTSDFFNSRFTFITKRKFSYILYPLSGGFENKAMIPNFMIPLIQFLEVLLTPLKTLLAFRCLIAIEKI